MSKHGNPDRVYTRKPLVKLSCKNCGKPFEVLEHRKDTAKFCTRECYEQFYRIHGWPSGKPRVEKICKKCGKVFWVKPSEPFRKYCSLPCALKDVHRSRKGIPQSDEVRRRMSERYMLHKQAVLKQADSLRKQGFKVLVADTGPRPDIFARKGGKLYAVEVELDNPDWNKYKGLDFFDDVHWVTEQRVGGAKERYKQKLKRAKGSPQGHSSVQGGPRA